MSQDESFQVTWKPPSMYAILPALLPFQIPPLASIRRSVSAYSLRTLRRDTGLKSEDLDLNIENKELAAPAQAEKADTTRKYAIQGISHIAYYSRSYTDPNRLASPQRSTSGIPTTRSSKPGLLSPTIPQRHDIPTPKPPLRSHRARTSALAICSS